MTNLEKAQARVKRAHAAYVAACERMGAVMDAEEQKAAAKVAAIREKADARIAAVIADKEKVVRPDMRSTLVENTRAALGLPPAQAQFRPLQGSIAAA